MNLTSLIIASALVFSLTACGAPQQTEPANTRPTSPYFLAVDKLINVDGVDIRVRDEGAHNAPVLVLAHGFTSSLETWDALAADLQSDYRIIRFDLPGHGLSGSDPTSDYSNKRTVDLVDQLLAALKIDKPTLIGSSLGGLVAWRLAAKHPDAFANLVLLAPGGFSINGVGDAPVDVPVMVQLYLHTAPEAGVAHASAALYGDPEKLTPQRLTEIGDMMRQPGNGAAFVARAGQFTLPDPVADLAKVNVPTLIIWGDKDVMVPPGHGPQFVDALPQARLLTYAGVGHLPHEESPTRLAQDIRDFLSSKDTP